MTGPRLSAVPGGCGQRRLQGQRRLGAFRDAYPDGRFFPVMLDLWRAEFPGPDGRPAVITRWGRDALLDAVASVLGEPAGEADCLAPGRKPRTWSGLAGGRKTTRRHREELRRMTVIMAAPAACRFESVYTAERESVPRARHEVEEFLSGCRRAADAGLIITELAANALFHSASRNGGKFTVRVRRHPAFLYLGVQDAGGSWGEATEDSHGLDIIRALCGRDGWGRVELDDGGRIVWALLPVSERSVLETRRIAFGEANPGVHFASPRDNLDGKWAAWWTDSAGNHKVQYPTQEELLDDLERRFGLTPLAQERACLARNTHLREFAALQRTCLRPRAWFSSAKGNPAWTERDSRSRDLRPAVPPPFFAGRGSRAESRKGLTREMRYDVAVERPLRPDHAGLQG